MLTGKKNRFKGLTVALLLLVLFRPESQAQFDIISISPDSSFQVMEGFGASLAYYEGWLNAHPNKAEIYDAIFAELSLDILRVRNAHEYDPSMIDRVEEYVTEAENSLGKPIDLLVTSWGPPGRLKSNGNKSGGGTLNYTIDNNQVSFNYSGFASWWMSSLDEYNSRGIYPDYISIQNEPDFTASYESCVLRPEEVVTAADTFAGYNKALDAVYDSVILRTDRPKLLGPECVGIGYNTVQNYVSALDLSKLDGIAHHLYHGANEANPYASDEYANVGRLAPEVPHFQTEFSRSDWWSVAGMMYKTLHDENAVAYLYWDLIWIEGNGLVSLDIPWYRDRWVYPRGYTRTRFFYTFKQYSAFIHPGWERLQCESNGDSTRVLAFSNSTRDSLALLAINLSESKANLSAINIAGYKIDEASVYSTSESLNCEYMGDATGSLLELPPQSITTVQMKLSSQAGQVLTEEILLHPSDSIIDLHKDSISISAEVLPENSSNKTVFWQIIEGHELASLSQNGVLKALGTGDGYVTVQAMAADGSGIKGESRIHLVNQVLVEEIKVLATAGKINTPQGQIQFTATALPEEAFDRSLSFELLSGSDIASLSSGGLLEALGTGDGSVQIRVYSNDGSGIEVLLNISISNQVAVNAISISSPSLEINTPEGSMQLSASVSPENASNQNIYWSLEQEDSLATIDQSGLLQATGRGNGDVLVKAESEAYPDIMDQLTIQLTNQESGVNKSSPGEYLFRFDKSNLIFTVPESIKERKLSIYSMNGALLQQQIIEPGLVSGSFAVQLKKSALLIVRLEESQGNITQKIYFSGN